MTKKATLRLRDIVKENPNVSTPILYKIAAPILKAEYDVSGTKESFKNYINHVKYEIKAENKKQIL